MQYNPAAITLIWVGIIIFIAGSIVGLVPMDGGGYGSAWFPSAAPPGIFASSMGISIVLLLIGGAAGITGTVLLSSKK